MANFIRFLLYRQTSTMQVLYLPTYLICGLIKDEEDVSDSTWIVLLFIFYLNIV